jgi:hypothetical protein
MVLHGWQDRRLCRLSSPSPELSRVGSIGCWLLKADFVVAGFPPAPVKRAAVLYGAHLPAADATEARHSARQVRSIDGWILNSFATCISGRPLLSSSNTNPPLELLCALTPRHTRHQGTSLLQELI